MMMPGDDSGIRASRPQRFEIYTGAGRRRIWSSEEKVAILAESFAGHETISAVARRHGLARSQLFAWRWQCREEREAAGIAALAKSCGIAIETFYVRQAATAGVIAAIGMNALA